jgi:molybdopterin molybdotransferase
MAARSDLTSLEAAREIVLGAARPLEAEEVELDAALGRTAAAPVLSPRPSPPFDNSAMDGFAVRAADTAAASESAPVDLAIVDESRAGAPAARELAAGQTIRISTGAMLPAGSDAVVRLEDASEETQLLHVSAPVEAGRDVRRAGEDADEGAQLIAAGTRIGPAEVGVLAAAGAASLRCHCRPRLALVVCGDELAAPGEPLGPGQIHDSNSHSVAAQARLAGAVVDRVAVVGDDYERMLAAFRDAIAADLLVVCGGVSVGRHDHTKAALAELGVEPAFWGLALRPGRPTWFGAHGRTLVFGLPGNPVSAMITFQLLVRPAVRVLSGGNPAPRRTEGVLEAGHRHRPGRLEAVRCRLELHDDGWHALPTGRQGSHILTSMLGAQGLAMIEAERGDVSAGERVTIELLDY